MNLDDMSELPQAVTTLTPEDSFTYAWVSELLEQVLTEVKVECEKTDKMLHWHIFHDRALKPIMEGSKAPSLEVISRKYSISDTAKASNMIVTVKRRFQTILRQHLRNSVMSDKEAEEELKEIRRFLPQMAQDSG